MVDGEKLYGRSFVALPEVLQEIRADLRKELGRLGLSRESRDGLVLAADEACSNIIRHGYGAKNTGEIIVEIFHNTKEIIVRLTDSAPRVEMKSLKGRDLDDLGPGGLGLHFIRKLTDRVAYPDPPEGVGNIVELVKSKD